MPSHSKTRLFYSTNRNHHHHLSRLAVLPSDTSAPLLFFEAIPGIPYGRSEDDARRLLSSSISGVGDSSSHPLRGSQLVPLETADGFD